MGRNRNSNRDAAPDASTAAFQPRRLSFLSYVSLGVCGKALAAGFSEQTRD